ncbi:Hypothetical protein NCS54_00993300 [Fusarium falciforme]|uniref:Hypothetical protein n=1 Tax=Fusarium falciforme TaxID=195108 RepID=UPI0022FFE599|nr:Hypothetical protein NCS54_00993300 [Fusarium falciforme]WAO92424.1 Hypothetical protein NCS54_00993300 [Fusarium falciforme]
MSSSDEIPPRPNDVPSLAARRAHMDVVFRQHGPYTEKMMAASRAKAVRTICFALRGYKKIRVSQVYFEYLVDLTIWDNWMFYNELPGTGVPFPECPWAEIRPDPSDMSEGLSLIYAQWLRDNFPDEKHDGKAPAFASDEKTASKAPETPAAGSTEQPPVAAEPEPEPEPEPESVAAESQLEHESDAAEPETIAAEDMPGPEPEPASAPSVPASHEVVFRPKTEAKRTRAPAQGLSSSRWAPPPTLLVAADAQRPKGSPPIPRGSMVCPPVPSLAAREHAWKATFGDGLRDEPFCGPFEVRIPCWIEFEELIWGHNGQIFAKVRDIIHRDLAISWEDEKPTSVKGGQGMPLSVDYEGRPYKLIVGFSKGVDHTHGANQSLLLALWNSVAGWAGLAHIGTSMTLAEYLRVNQARQDAVVIGTMSGPRNPVRALYKESQENTLAAQQAARKEKCAMERWQCEVHEILQNPIEIATERLDGWVMASGHDMDLRITVAERVWAMSVSDPVKMAQGSHWAHCLRSGLRVVREN